MFAGVSLIELAWLRGDDEAVVDIATGLRPLGDAWFGIRVACEFAGACAAIQLGADFQPELTSFALPAVWAGLHELEGIRRWRAGDKSGALDELDRAACAWLDVECPRWSIRAEGLAAVLARKARRPDATARWAKVEVFAKRVGLSHHLRRWHLTQPALSTREVGSIAARRYRKDLGTDRGDARDLARHRRRSHLGCVPQAARVDSTRGCAEGRGTVTRDRRPVAIVTAGACPQGAVALRSLPDEPFSLCGVRAYGVIHDERDRDAVLLALARGADVVIVIDLPAPRGPRCSTRSPESPSVRIAGVLTTEEREVVDGLVQGQTLTEVARSLGMSRRTATRRLAAAKLAFGAATTMELILSVTHSMS